MKKWIKLGVVLCGAAAFIPHAYAGVSETQAAQLKSSLTPLGGEKAGNADGSIPAWTGGMTAAPANFGQDKIRADLFADEKPLYSISAANMAQYADKLSGATKILLEKFSDQRLDVYPTHRTAAAPDWVYENTFANATRVTGVPGPAGMQPQGAIGGIPFPIPQNGEEAIWNQKLRWRGTSWHWYPVGTLVTAAGQKVLINDSENQHFMPYYLPGMTAEELRAKYHDDYWLATTINAGPPIRAGEALALRQNFNEDLSATWVYLTGQRRVRKLPNACCDTPTPFSAGLSVFDEIEGFLGRTDRFDWTIVGKQEMYIPYNTNKTATVPLAEALGESFLSPDHVRWELHRVWVIEANLKPGSRHTSPRSRYYLDEDTWVAALSDRWDANGQLWRGTTNLIFACPDIPATVNISWGFKDLISGAWYMNGMPNDKPEQYRIVPPYSDAAFTPDGLAAMGIR